MKPNLNETLINKADVKAVFQDATALRDKPTGLGKVFKRLRKDKVDINDLQKAWAEDGYPNDTRDIKRILLKFGFNDKEVNNVFSKVFGREGSDEYEEPVASPAIQRIADYAKRTGLDKALIEFLEQEYGEELGVKKNAVHEEIRQIFSAIVQEERVDRFELIRQLEQTQLGRTKK